MKTVLTIAGSDSGGAGGIQADIKTIATHGLYATSAITSMTAQNTTGVYDIQESTPKFLGRQLDCVFDDIYPDAVKIGMVSNPELIDVIAEKLNKYHARNVVLDTNIVSNSGRRLVGNKAERIIMKELVPLAEVILPSIPEAESISGIKIGSIEDMGAAAGIISEKYSIKGIFLKEGYRITDKGDMLFENGRISWIPGRYESDGTSMGKSCALSAAIACNLAQGYSLNVSINKAKQYVTGAVKERLELGKGRNPVNHLFQSNV
jgi:hydroxymethylpyrimidine/phosphomethylpyrimidine kinase